MRQILLADDDAELSALLQEYLSNHDIDCDCVADGEAALSALQHQTYDLVILDIMMPKIDGLTVLKQLTNNITTPIIMLTAKGDDVDRIIGLELGADDYIAKPCNPRELLARIHAVIKRSQPREAHQAPPLPNSLIRMDLNTRSCYFDEQELQLTGTEFDLLYTLLQHKGQTIDKSTLSQTVLQRELQPFDRSIDVHISRLRKKLSTYQEDAIKSIRGKGYQLAI